MTLDAHVNFDGTKFTVTNLGKDAWKNIRCTLNGSGLLGRGYNFNVNTLKPGEQFSVGAMQFAKSDGTRFNPFQTKPTSMSIAATVNGKSGHYYGGW